MEPSSLRSTRSARCRLQAIMFSCSSVGLKSAELSIARVETRVSSGGHAVETQKLMDRFPRTQHAIRQALDVVNAAILVDNSRDQDLAFTVCQVRASNEVLFDWRD